MSKRKPKQESESETYTRLVREGLAANKTPEDGPHEAAKPEGGAWFWYLMIVLMACAAAYKTVGAP
jgi:hypothetical protein